MYAFCINPKHPGYFYLCFKAGGDAPLGNWTVKILPNGFELRNETSNIRYPDMSSLKNGFKLMAQSAAGRL
jgi:transcription elongation factor SPT6